MALRVYNTLMRQKEPFPKRPPEPVTMYVCGPTVYKPSHIGHMVGPVIFDTVQRYLTHLGYPVKWVVNITDVDDKLIVRAREMNTSVKELAEKMTADYQECLQKLNVRGITHMPRATEYIPHMIRMMERLIEKGYAYAAGGDVYFDIGKDADYGKLCNRDPEQLEAGARIEVTDKKRNPGDFALWKGSKPGEPFWESPWGPGRPGWHIECSAMSMELLGETIDIHGGGLDLQFPHHENELAQSESFTDKPFARFWMHNGLLRPRNANIKMGGSHGNAVNMVELFTRHQPETIRFLLLSNHYRSPIVFDDDALIETHRALSSFYRFFERVQRITGQAFYTLNTKIEKLSDDVEALRARFFECMDDDFNTGGAVGVLFDLLNTLNSHAESHKLEASANDTAKAAFVADVQLLRELSGILGLFDRPPQAPAAASDTLVNGLMQLLIDLRNDARKNKNFAVADQIRQRLTALKVTLEDRANGTGWRAE